MVKRRRSPGLLREEVAQMAGISVAYYTWIEQGRDINMSAEVLNAIARTLHLTEAERVHLFTLVGMDLPQHAGGDDELHPSIAHILHDPAGTWCGLVYDGWFTLEHRTRLAGEVFGLEPGHGLESNLLYALFAQPRQRRLWLDWEAEARIAVGMFRQELAREPDSPEGHRLLDALFALPDFQRLWEAYDVSVLPSPDEFFRSQPWVLAHPRVGTLLVHRLATAIPARRERMLMLYTPADAETGRKFDLLDRNRALHLVPAAAG